MPAEDNQILASSTDGDELVLAALALARADEPQGHAALRERLQAAEFLNRLDSQEEYDNLSVRLRLRRVLEALQDNQAGGARQTLVSLTQSSAFQEHPRRVDLLIKACASIRPAPPAVVAFWDAHCQPLDGYTPLTIRALLDNGSEPALKLFEKKMLDPDHEDIDKIEWLRWDVLRHRNDAPLLACCRRLLTGPLAEPIRPLLVDVLFAYRRALWYGRRERVPVPPPREEAGEDALALLRAIGRYALENVELSDPQKQAVSDAVGEGAEDQPETPGGVQDT